MSLRKIFICLCLSGLLAAPSGQNLAYGQSLALGEFKTKCDTLQTLIKERTSVTAIVRLESVSKRNGALDFHFSSNIGDIPWTKEDIVWLRKTMHELAPGIYANYKIGNIYCNNTLLEELAHPFPNNTGKPVDNKYKRQDPLKKAAPALVTDQDALFYDKGLSGRHIALWQSHGRYYNEDQDRWKWQRAPLFTTIEDLFTQSFVLPFLIPMLENSGACVMTPRERDPQKHEIIADNDPAFSGERTGLVRHCGKYVENGKWSDAGTGFADFKEVYTGNDNPFTAGTARKAACTKTELGNSVATWTAEVPERGAYAVYVSYASLPNSSESAHYTVKHLGGTSNFLVNQKMGGGTWIYLGTFEFAPDSEGQVTLDNGTQHGTNYVANSVVTADAVRFGGGMGKIARGPKDTDPSEYTVSGLPSYVEGALYWMQWAGMDSTIIKKFGDDYINDYGTRGSWVSHLSGGSFANPKKEGLNIPVDLSFAFHTDAGTYKDDSIVGTLAIYTLLCEGSRKYGNGDDRILGRYLTADIQSQIVEDLRTQYDSLWNRRMLADRSYSESRTTGVPGMLLELLSHQNFADMKYGLDPAFRFTVSRAIYKGMLKFLSNRYGFRYAVQPLPVKAFSSSIRNESQATLTWKENVDTLEATAKPKGFILYTRIDDGAFDNGQVLDNVKLADGVYTADVKIGKGHIYSYKIAAYNDGGKSFPSEVMSIGIPDSGNGRKVLVVNDFDRVAPPAWFDSPAYAGFDCTLDCGVGYMNNINFIGEMYQCRRSLAWQDDDNAGFGASYTDQAGKVIPGNTFDYPAVHGRALMDAGYTFCSSSSEAFKDGTTDKFFAVDIICGKQVSTPVGCGRMYPNRFQVFPKELREAITDCTKKGINILVSGANIGTDLWDEVYSVGRDKVYQTEAQEFVKTVLGYSWRGNYASRTGLATPCRNDALNVSAVSFWQEENDKVYRVETPDGLLPANENARTFLRYSDTDLSAGICYIAKNYRTVSLGFPLETVKEPSELAGLMKDIMDFFAKKN